MAFRKLENIHSTTEQNFFLGGEGRIISFTDSSKNRNWIKILFHGLKLQEKKQ